MTVYCHPPGADAYGGLLTLIACFSGESRVAGHTAFYARDQLPKGIPNVSGGIFLGPFALPGVKIYEMW